MTWDFRKEINMNINEISAAYLEEKEQRRRASTVDGYRSSINLYILPEFGKIDIAAIEPEAIQAWIDGKAIYRKVIQFGAMSGNNRYTKAHGISYDTIVSFNAIAQ